MTDFPSPQLPATYRIYGRGDSLWSRGQILAEVSTGTLRADSLIQREDAPDWQPLSVVFPEFGIPKASATSASTARTATLGKRVWAYLLDSCVIGVPMFGLALGGTLITVVIPNHDDIALLLYVTLISMGGVAAILYLILTPLSGLDATLGMYFMGLRLTDSHGQRITLKTSVVRVLTALCISGFCGIGYFWAFFDQKRRTLHDIFAGTTVVDVRI